MTLKKHAWKLYTLHWLLWYFGCGRWNQSVVLFLTVENRRSNIGSENTILSKARQQFCN